MDFVSFSKTIIDAIENAQETHPDGDATVTRTASIGYSFNADERIVLEAKPTLNLVPEPIRSIFSPIDQVLDRGQPFKDEMDDPERARKSAISSFTVHSEIEQTAPHFACGQYCCPRCMAYSSLRGVRSIALSHKSLNDAVHGEWALRRGLHPRTIEIAKRGSVTLKILEPNGVKPIKVLKNEFSACFRDEYSDLRNPRPDFKFVDTALLSGLSEIEIQEYLEGCAEMLLLHKPVLNSAMNYAAYAYGRDEDGQNFAIVAVPSLPPGYSEVEYISKILAKDQAYNEKYSLIVPPMTAIRAYLSAQGIKPISIQYGATNTPTMRDLINTLSVFGLRGIHMSIENPNDIKPPIDADIRNAVHKNGDRPYKVYRWSAAMHMIKTACQDHGLEFIVKHRLLAEPYHYYDTVTHPTEDAAGPQ